MRAIEASYENGVLRPARPLPLRPGERVAVVVMRRPDPARWDLSRLAAASAEDETMAEAGLAEWSADLEREDRGP
jgi:predicted DNA-binding antitoxin AbrB/MazE fold protein